MRHHQYFRLLLAGLFCLPIFFSNINSLIAGHFVGNGGDHIRSSFLWMGDSIVKFLSETSAGKNLVTQNHLDVAALKKSLTIQKITVSDSVLIDNGGSLVDALGQPNKIVLFANAWYDHFQYNRDIYYLVFHEMLRENGVDDDDYVISKYIYPFSGDKKGGTRVIPNVALISSQLLSNKVDINGIIFNGTGCSVSKGKTFSDFDVEENILTLSFRQYQIGTGLKQAVSSSDRKNCSIAIPFKVPANKKLVITQLDVKGQVIMPLASEVLLGLESFVTDRDGTSLDSYNKQFTIKGAVNGGIMYRENNVLESNCGSNANLRLNTSLRLNRQKAYDMDQVWLDKIKVYLKLEDCR